MGIPSGTSRNREYLMHLTAIDNRIRLDEKEDFVEQISAQRTTAAWLNRAKE